VRIVAPELARGSPLSDMVLPAVDRAVEAVVQPRRMADAASGDMSDSPSPHLGPGRMRPLYHKPRHPFGALGLAMGKVIAPARKTVARLTTMPR
jgi:hypothetical protein